MYLKYGQAISLSYVVWDLMCILQWPGSTVLCSSFTFDISRHLRLQLLRLFPGIISWEINPRLYRSVSSGTGHKQCSLEAASEFRTAFPSFSAIVCRVRNDVVLCALFSCINSFCCIWYYSDLCSLDFPFGQIMLPEGIILKKIFPKKYAWQISHLFVTRWHL